MFKKPIKIGAQNQLSGKDKKSIKNKLATVYDEESVEKLFTSNDKIICNKVSGSKMLIYSGEQYPLLVDGTGKDDFFPSIYVCSVFQPLLKIIELNEGVENYIFNGANLMWPGVRDYTNLGNFKKDDVTAIIDAKGEVIAIGAMGCSLEELKKNNDLSGIAVFILHYRGDKLWEMGPKTYPEAIIKVKVKKEEIKEEVKVEKQQVQIIQVKKVQEKKVQEKKEVQKGKKKKQQKQVEKKKTPQKESRNSSSDVKMAPPPQEEIKKKVEKKKSEGEQQESDGEVDFGNLVHNRKPQEQKNQAPGENKKTKEIKNEKKHAFSDQEEEGNKKKQKKKPNKKNQKKKQSEDEEEIIEEKPKENKQKGKKKPIEKQDSQEEQPKQNKQKGKKKQVQKQKEDSEQEKPKENKQKGKKKPVQKEDEEEEPPKQNKQKGKKKQAQKEDEEEEHPKQSKKNDKKNDNKKQDKKKRKESSEEEEIVEKVEKVEKIQEGKKKQKKESDSEGEEGEHEEGTKSAITSQLMDEHLKEAFLNVLKLSKVEGELPIDSGRFYIDYMLLARSEGVKLDVKDSSFKKLGKFYEEMAKKKFIQFKPAKEKKGQQGSTITKIFWECEELKNYIPTIKKMGEKDVEQKPQQYSKYKLKLTKTLNIQYVYRLNDNLKKVLLKKVINYMPTVQEQKQMEKKEKEEKFEKEDFMGQKQLKEKIQKYINEISKKQKHEDKKEEKVQKAEKGDKGDKGDKGQKKIEKLVLIDYKQNEFIHNLLKKDIEEYEQNLEKEEAMMAQAEDSDDDKKKKKKDKTRKNLFKIERSYLVNQIMRQAASYYQMSDHTTNLSKFKDGVFKGIQLIADKIINKNVTKIIGLQNFVPPNVQPEEIVKQIHGFAQNLQLKFASSSTVQNLPGKNAGKEIIIQGNFVDELEAILMSEYGIKKDYITIQNKLGKKKKN